MRVGNIKFARLHPSAALLALVLAAACAPHSLPAQTHKVAKPENVVRAIGVYEWTGDMAKPASSRLIPVSLFIDGKLEDAGVYLARPVPFALMTGNVYELDQAGVPKGTLDLMYTRHFEATAAATAPYDDGWFGYGRFVPPAPPVKSTLKPSKTLASINVFDDDDSRPHFSSKSATPGTGGAASSTPGATDSSSSTPADDPDRPVMKRHAGTSDTPATSDPSTPSSTTASGSTPPADPDRPTMKRHPDTSDASDASPATTTASSGSGSAKDTSPDDPDRPTLRRRSPADAKRAQADHASVSDPSDALNNDPNRPMLHRGKPAGVTTETDFPKLSGLPGDQDLHQMVAISDAANRPVHDFSRAWADDEEHQAILTRMQAAARSQLSVYEAANGAKPAVTSNPDTRHPNSKLRRPATPVDPLPAHLLDEQLKAYTLSYGGSPTYVYSAHTDGLGPTLRYVLLVAQVDIQGLPALALKSVTDAAHLDRAPRMRLVDAVDAEASNRASLLFELREQGSRQFALYRVIGARADQTFLTGTTQ